MTKKSDERLGMVDNIERRDFINGVLKGSVALAASGLAPGLLASAAGMPIPPADTAAATTQGAYPPVLTGMRGSSYPAYVAGHAMRDHTLHVDKETVEDTGEEYDLIVVGGGISGLSAALFYVR